MSELFEGMRAVNGAVDTLLSFSFSKAAYRHIMV